MRGMCMATCLSKERITTCTPVCMAAPRPTRFRLLPRFCAHSRTADGHIRIPGFYDRVVQPDPKEHEAWARLPFDEKEYLEKEMGARELVGEPGVPLFDRLWSRPTLEVPGIRGGFTGEGAKTVIPARAVAKVSARLVADQRTDEATQQLQQAVKAACPKGVRAEFKPLHSGAPSLTNPDNPFIQAAAEAMKQVFGKECVYIRSGGSIPIVGLFDQYLGIPSVMMGFGLPDDNLHAPMKSSICRTSSAGLNRWRATWKSWADSNYEFIFPRPPMLAAGHTLQRKTPPAEGIMTIMIGAWTGAGGVRTTAPGGSEYWNGV